MTDNRYGYKAFEAGFKCKGKQYEENTIYEENGDTICGAGVMHYCVDPFDVLDYKDLVDENGNIAEFSEVEALGDVYKKYNKYATNKLRIKAKLGLKGFIKACIDFTFEIIKCDSESKISSGNSARIGSSGNWARINSKGKNSVVMAAGYESKAKAKIGSWITLAEWKYDGEVGNYIPVCVKTEQVDGERIKEDIFYQLIDGEFTEVE